MQKRFVRVFTTNRQDQLALVKSLLISEGIEFRTSNENLNLVHGAADGWTLMEVSVPEEQAATARELLNGLSRE